MKEKILNYIGQDGLLHIKEFVRDKWLGKGTFDKKDLLCDFVGIIIGCL